MDLPTYTNIWRIEKRLYKLYDFRLPMPLPVGTFGVALGVFALWVVLLSLLNAPFVFGNGWHLVLWVVPPGVITVLATRPVIEGKRLTELLLSQARFLTEARVYNRLAPEYEPSEVRVTVRVWHRAPEAGPLPLAGRPRAEEEAAAGPERTPARAEEARPSGAEAPPLRGVAAPPAPVREAGGDPVYTPAGIERAPAVPERPSAASERAPARAERAPADGPERAPASRERAPVAVAARPEPEERRPLPPEEGFPGGRGGSDPDPGTPDRTRRGVGRRVLNYFGFGLEPEPSDPPEEARPRRREPEPADDGLGGGFDEDFVGERVYETEGEEQRDSDAWFASLRASSGETPVGLSSKSAYSVGDTAAMSRQEAVGEAAEADRAEEETPAARRLRGRTQGIRVAKDLEERRSERVREPGPREQRSARAQGRGLPDTGRAPERPRRRGRPHAAPWELTEGRTDQGGQADMSDYAARYAAATGRPAADTAAMPWLPPSSPEEEAGERARPEESADGTADDRESGGDGAPAAESRSPGRVSGAPAAPEAPATGSEPAERAAPGTAGTPVAEPESEEPEPAGRAVRGADDSAAVEAPAPPQSAKPPLELDHGTGEQAAMPAQPREEPEDRGPKWNEHMSVLDQHLSTADTPAPPRPKFADAVPDREPGDRAKDPARWFEDGKRRHPDQPKVGDRGNPVIPASELREDGSSTTETGDAEESGAGGAEVAKAGGTEADKAGENAEPDAGASGRAESPVRGEGPKPPTQLDHGTGELASFAEVREDPARGDVNVRADAAGSAARRRTVSDLEEAEAAALARRRRAAESGNARGSDDAPPAAAPAAEPRPEGAEDSRDQVRARWSMRATGSAAVSGEEAAAREETAGPPEHGDRPERTEPNGRTERPGAADRTGHAPRAGDDGPEPHQGADPHDGVFHRVAQNARRIGHLFGQPAPGEEPEPPRHEARTESKPELELDHGTGEQERLGDTPSGVPSHRPEPAEARARQEEPAGDSGGTRGWRRLAKVVTGGAAPVRSDLPASDIERLRTPLDGPRNLVVLGCTGGAGQTVTTLMIGHTLAAHRDEPVVAVDVNPGPNGLSRRVGAQTPETLTSLLANAGAVRDHARMSAYTSRTETGLEVIQTLDDPYVQTLDDRDYGQLTSLLGGFYGLTLLDPAATGVARALPAADGLVLVAPASADAERAVSMTFDWLDGNGYANLRARSVLVVNGVSKRSLEAVDAAERVARGRCRAIVRIPWDDHLGSSYTRIDVGALRPATKRAHGALGGVLVTSLAH
ncbi:MULTISPECIES: conjugal transfer protein [unclassified Nocardiopsis]|uniref:conjugal transfer protein n=1 Tax=unclassified Nocardiopsis TaxID=2649073 RepID=UPI0013573CAE|nr:MULTISPECIES: conjugal transfer protein [unclassified Nocardiopsis]